MTSQQVNLLEEVATPCSASETNSQGQRLKCTCSFKMLVFFLFYFQIMLNSENTESDDTPKQLCVSAITHTAADLHVKQRLTSALLAALARSSLKF